MLVAVDFDSTIVHYDKPLPGAKEALQKLKDLGHNILIHSCNNDDWIRRVLNDNDIPYDYIWDGVGKPVCACYIDDRAIRFKGDWNEALEQVEGFEVERAKLKAQGKIIL